MDHTVYCNIPPEEVLKVCDPLMPQHTTVRIHHLECSAQKTDACVVRRSLSGWWWRCYRCGKYGHINNDLQSPKTVLQLLDDREGGAMQKGPKTRLSLPTDFLSMHEEFSHTIPLVAYQWIKQYSIPWGVIRRYNVGWSFKHYRVIIPIYQYSKETSYVAKKLVGWVGRDVGKRTKEERAEKHIPKYLSYKDPDVRRLIFHAPPQLHRFEEALKVVVVVEDALSAMKINAAFGCETFAVLTTFVPEELVMNVASDKLVVVWLDFDQFNNAQKYIHKWSTWGVRCTSVTTKQDPKSLSEFDLRTRLRTLITRMEAYDNEKENINGANGNRTL